MEWTFWRQAICNANFASASRFFDAVFSAFFRKRLGARESREALLSHQLYREGKSFCFGVLRLNCRPRETNVDVLATNDFASTVQSFDAILSASRRNDLEIAIAVQGDPPTDGGVDSKRKETSS